MAEHRVLLVEPFLGGSHRAWAEGWQQHSRHDVDILALPGREWRRRMRAGSVELAARTATWVSEHGSPDLVVATNMLDLAGYLGLARRSLGSVAAVQFMHENQFSYPRQPGEAFDAGLAWMQWRGLSAADEVWFNSAHHCDALLAGLDALDDPAREDTPLVEPSVIEAKSWVAHLGIEFGAIHRERDATRPKRPLVVSNQRWHHDKDLGSVLRALITARERGFDFDVALLGDSTGGEAEALGPLVERLGDAVVAKGHLERSEYLDLLGRADIVVSAARNENFGLAVVEAIAAGAWPVLPDALSYPEIVPAEFWADCLYEPGKLGRLLRDVVERVASGESADPGLAASMERFDWPTVAAALDERVDQVAAV